MSILEYLFWGIKSLQAKQSTSPINPRLPITPAILRKLLVVWNQQPSNPYNIMLWAACTTCFFGFLRSGEITSPNFTSTQGQHLAFGDVTLDSRTSPKMVQVRIKASKTDPFQQGVSIFLGITNNDLCPVAAMAVYLASRAVSLAPFSNFLMGNP